MTATLSGLLATYDIITDILIREDEFAAEAGLTLAVARDIGGTANLVDAINTVLPKLHGEYYHSLLNVRDRLENNDFIM